MCAVFRSWKKPRYRGLFQRLRARIFRNKFYSSFLSIIINPRRRLSVTVCFSTKCCCVRRRPKQQVSARRPRPRLLLYRTVVVVGSCSPSDILGIRGRVRFMSGLRACLCTHACVTRHGESSYRVQTVIFFHKFHCVCVCV